MWQYLLRNWAYGKAREHVQKAAMDAVRQRADQSASGEEDEADEPRDLRCDVLIIAASASELGSLADQLTAAVGIRGDGFRATFGETRGRRVVLAYAAQFKRPAEEVARTIIRAHQPRWVIAGGFASGLSDRLRRGQMFVARRIVAADGRSVAIDVQMEESDGKPAIRVGALLSTDQPYNRIAQKQALAAEFTADAVERTAIDVAHACQAEKTPLLAVHVISDTVADDLPRDIRAILEQPSTAGKLGAATGALLNRVSSVKDMWQLKEDSLLAAEALGKFLADMLEQLPPANHKEEP